MNKPTTGYHREHLSPFQENLAKLNPVYFALVMATGIVSIACHLLQMPRPAQALFWINIGAYTIMVILVILRLLRFPRQLFADLIDHNRGVGFFTMVAGTCVLGNQFLLIGQMRSVAVALWCLGIVLWFLLNYTIFTAFAVKEKKPSLPDGIHGGWLVSVVATQSVALLGGLLADGFGEFREQVLFFSLAMWLSGGMHYIWIISLIFYRYYFFSMSPADLAPPYWINMGAMAISTLVGAILISVSEGSAILGHALPFLKGFTLFFWATATAWIPMLVILGIWRHLVMRFPLTYDPQYWGGVFPLGMYAVSTHRLATTLDLPFLLFIPQLFIYFALVAWLATFVGMLRSLMQSVGKRV